MKNSPALKKMFVLLAFLSFITITKAQDTSTWTEKSAKKWLNSKEWRNGMTLKVHASVNKVVFAQQYHKNKAIWDKAFAFLRDSDLLKMKPGKYVIDGDNVFATITEGPSKTFEQSAWESHRKYIDLQYVIRGKEKIGVAPVTTATVTKPYNEKSDGANYTAEGQYFIAEPGTFFLFFPGDAHRPNILVDGYDMVKKLVIKIRVAE
jgi:YhcH/YjgK/YiaL family protein